MNLFMLLIKTAVLILVALVVCLSWYFDYSLLEKTYGGSFSPEAVVTISLLFATVLSAGRVLSYFGVAMVDTIPLKITFLFTSGLLAIVSLAASLLFIANALVSPNLEQAVKLAKDATRTEYDSRIVDLNSQENAERKAVVEAYKEREQTVRASFEPQITQFDEEIAFQSKRVYVSGANKGSPVGPAYKALVALKADEMNKLTASLSFVSQQRTNQLAEISERFNTLRAQLLAEKHTSIEAITADTVDGSQAASNSYFWNLTKLVNSLGMNIKYDGVITAVSVACALILELLFFLAVYAAAGMMRPARIPTDFLKIENGDEKKVFQNLSEMTVNHS
jgi:hypothetical protein